MALGEDAKRVPGQHAEHRYGIDEVPFLVLIL
jgi:hypothetical protein